MGKTDELLKQLQDINVRYTKYVIIKDSFNLNKFDGFKRLPIYNYYLEQYIKPYESELLLKKEQEYLEKIDALKKSNSKSDFLISIDINPPSSDILSAVADEHYKYENLLLKELKDTSKKENRKDDYFDYIDKKHLYTDLAIKEILSEIESSIEKLPKEEKILLTISKNLINTISNISYAEI